MAKVFRIEKDTLVNASFLFSGCTDLEVFSTPDNGGGWGANGHYYPALENATAMFNDAYYLKVAYCSMPNLITATEMFGEAGALRDYDLEEIENCFIALELGGRLTNAEQMFYGAKNFKHIDVRNLGHKNSSNSANYKHMFSNVRGVGDISLYIASDSLENLDMTYAFNYSDVKTMTLPSSEKFGRVSVSNFQKIKNCSGMFNNCSAEGGILLNYSSRRAANNDCNLSSMFYQTRTPKISINGSLQEVYKQGQGLIGGLCYIMNTASGVNIGGMFDECTFPESVDWVEEPKSWEGGGVSFTDATALFAHNKSLRSFTAKDTLNGGGEWSLAYMAFGYSYIENLSLTNSFNNCTTDQMFSGCTKLKNVYVENSLNSPFEPCDNFFSASRLRSYSSYEGSMIESITMYNAFANCTSLTYLCYDNYGAGWDGGNDSCTNPGILTVGGTGCGASGVDLSYAFGVDFMLTDSSTGELNFSKLVFDGDAYTNGGWRNIGNVANMFKYRQIADESTINWVSTCATYSTVSSTTSMAQWIQTPYNMINTWKNYGWSFGTATNTSYQGKTYKEVLITHSTSSGKSITAKLVYKPS